MIPPEVPRVEAGEATGSRSGDLVAVAVDAERCIGGGLCEMLEPETFLVDEDTVMSSVIGAGTLPRLRAEVVVDRCPGAAISIASTGAGTAGGSRRGSGGGSASGRAG